MNGKTSPALATGVVVTYQSMRTLQPMIEAARRCHDEGVLELVFVDNGSKDGTVERLQRESGWATVIPTGNNNGFGRGCNIGFEKVTTPYTVFINPDAVVEPDAIRKLVDFLEKNPHAGIAGPAIVEGETEADFVLQGVGERATPMSLVRSATPLLRAPSGMRTVHPGEAPFRAGWVCGAVFMIRTELLRKLGGFDPRFFLYWEETDLCQRADDLGQSTWAVGEAVTRHIGGASSAPDSTRIGGCIAKHYYQSRRYYMIKHHGWLAATAAELVESVFLVIRAAVDLVRGRGLTRLRPRLQAPLLSQPRTPA
jgi:GT2 family glycosyltransferase